MKKKPVETYQVWYFCSACNGVATDVTRPVDRSYPNVQSHGSPLGQPNRLCPKCFQKFQQARIERDKAN